MALLLIFVTALIFFGSTASPRNAFREEGLSMDLSRALRGAFALLVFTHHVYQNLFLWEPFRLLADVGPLFVGGFFFLSGYGLMVSLSRKEHYLKGFLPHRLLAVYLPFAVVTLTQVPIRIQAGAPLSPAKVWGAFLFHPMLDPNHWYVIAILLFYLLFFFSYRWLPKAWGILPVLTGVIGYAVLFSHLTRGQTWWYNAVFCFPAGLLLASLPADFFRRKWRFWTFLSVILTFITFLTAFAAGLDRRETFLWMLSHMGSVTRSHTVDHGILILQNMAAVLFSVSIYLFSQKIALGNRLLFFYGKISYEFYLIHGAVLFFVKKALFSSSDTLFALLSLFLSTLLAWGLHALCASLLNLIFRRKKYVSGK